MKRFGYYLSLAYYDICFGIFFSVLTLKLFLFDHIIRLGMLSFFADLGTMLALLSFSLIIKNKIVKLIYLLFVDFFVSFIFLANSLYRSYFEDFASIYDIGQMSQVIDVIDSVIALMGEKFLFIIDFIFLPFLLLLRLKEKYNFNIRERARTFCILFCLGLYLNLTLFSSIKGGLNPFVFSGERTIFVWYFGIINYQISDGWCYLAAETGKRHVAQSDIDLVIKGRTPNPVLNDFTNSGKGLNVIMIQAESLQNFVIGKRHNGREITPHLNKLINEGIYFNNFHDQTAEGNSSDATLLANASLYPARKGAASFRYPHNCFDSLPKILKGHNYTTAVMYPYMKSFWNSATFDRALGFEHQFYQDNFVMEDKIGLGLSDRRFFEQALVKIRNLPQPFYVILRTLTSHFPYSYVTKDIDDFPLGDLEGEILGHYIRSMHYVDFAIGEFLSKLSEDGLFSKTIIVIYGDHRARLPDDGLKKMGIIYVTEGKKIPLIISLPNRKQRYWRNTLGGLIDLAPTLCNILGIDPSNRFFMGRDLGNSDESFVVFRDGSYVSEGGSINRTFAQERLTISDLILEKDLIPLIRTEKRCW